MFHNAFHECSGETGVEEEDVKKALRGEITETDTIKTQTLCVGKKLGILNDEGVIQTEVIKEKFSEIVDKIDEMVEKCVVDKGNAEDTAFAFAKCTFSYNGEI